MNDVNSIIITPISKGRNLEFNHKRIQRITEALSFESGTKDLPLKLSIIILNDEKEVCFMKPGKEAFRARGKQNIHDMFPCVYHNQINLVNGYSFSDIWEYLIKISIISHSTFKKVLVLLYRLCFLIDHNANEFGNIRYNPSKDILEYINNIENFVLKEGFKEKFNKEEIGLIEFIHFIDLLGWNEDVKYNTFEGKPLIGTNKNRGRVNTILSVISTPLLISNFMLEVINKTENKGIIEVKLITQVIQKFINSRGICVLKNEDLANYLNPYLQN